MLHCYRWHWPYRPAGVFDEWPLLAGALVLGAAGALVVPRLWRRLAGAAAAIGAVAAVLGFLVLQAADPFVAQRTWRYAPPGCDFAVNFPRPAEIVSGEARLAGAPAQTVTRAMSADVGAATSLSAECLAFGRTLAEAERAATLDAAEAQLKAAAARLKLKVERVAREGPAAIVLSGTSDEGRTATNEILLRRAEARVVLGRSSLLIVWGWRIEREGEARQASPLGGLAVENMPAR